jgi:diguanylate cyclase (GGDEF)-like protein
MPQPGDGSQLQSSSEESLLTILAETVDGLEEAVRGAFLRQFFRSMAQVEINEAQSTEAWKTILERRRELSATGQTLSLRAILVEVLTSRGLLRSPVLMELDEFKKLQINAATDSLTGLYNRRLFDEYCDKELNRAKRYGHPLAIVILDLKKLKEVNDRHGHPRGDQVLILAATTFKNTLRSSDFAFRIGGDEFALLLPQSESEQADTLCRRVRAQYESEIQSLGVGVGVTLDFGIAVYPEDSEKMDDLMAIADRRLYELKASGRPSPEPAVTDHEARETKTPTTVAPHATVAPPSPAPDKTPPAPPPPAARPEQRKWERVSLAGTKAYAVFSHGQGQKRARVLDLSYGGVALMLESSAELPAQFSAVLHVPILPPVRVVLRKAYVRQAEPGRARIGCSFVS